MVAAGTTFKVIGSAIDTRAPASHNLFFPFVYNIMGIPVAAGAFNTAIGCCSTR
jgi:cation transport ATPase